MTKKLYDYELTAAQRLRLTYEQWRLAYESVHKKLTPDQQDAVWSLLEFLMHEQQAQDTLGN